MKRILIILMIAVGFIFLSCKKDSPTDNSQTNNVNPASGIFATESNWAVTSFMKNGTDQTLAYNSSKIIFSPNNDFAISNDVLSANGKWIFGTLAENSLHINFNNLDILTYDPWRDVQDVWKINSYTATTLDLQSADNSKMMSLQKLSR